MTVQLEKQNNMGYTTDFIGRFEFNKALTDDMIEVYKEFKDKRHEDGYEPNGKPSIWLLWEIEEQNGKFYLQWDESEKFYNYVEWLEYIIKYIFSVWQVVISGVVEWRGEEWDDMGSIIVLDNVVLTEARG